MVLKFPYHIFWRAILFLNYLVSYRTAFLSRYKFFEVWKSGFSDFRIRHNKKMDFRILEKVDFTCWKVDLRIEQKWISHVGKVNSNKLEKWISHVGKVNLAIRKSGFSWLNSNLSARSGILVTACANLLCGRGGTYNSHRIYPENPIQLHEPDHMDSCSGIISPRRLILVG